MRNLKLLKLLKREVQLDLLEKFCVDSLTATVYFCSATEIVSQQLTGKKECRQIQYRTQRYEGDSVVDIQFLSDQLLVSLVMAHGDVLFFDPETEEVKTMSSVPSGIKAANWSPDLELLVIVDGNSSLTLFSRDLEPLATAALNPVGFGTDEQVTVGWGKKETQFHGKEGKEAARVKSQNEITSVEWDDQRTRISWRGDGQFFTVSSYSFEKQARVIRVWTRECVHSSTLEPISSLGQTISWRPSGNLIASSLHIETTHSVVFYEMNGLRHGEFVLPNTSAQFQVSEMSWNLDSSILLVSAVDTETRKSFVQLWTTGNYHWYLKWECIFEAEERLRWCCWDTEVANCVHLCLQNGIYRQYQWFWDVDRPQATEKFYNETLVAVIDGAKLKLTAFSHGIIPPPMAELELEFPQCVTDVNFASSATEKSLFIVQQSDAKICLIEEDAKGDGLSKMDSCGFIKRWNPAFHVEKFDCCATFSGKDLFGLHLMKENFIIAAFADDSSAHVCALRLDRSKRLIEVMDRLNIGQTDIVKITKCDGSSVAVETADGNLLFSSIIDGKLVTKSSDGCPQCQKFPSFCPYVDSFLLNQTIVFVSLNNRYQFFVDGVEFGNNINSFVLRNGFLILTTLNHMLFSIPWSALNVKGDFSKLSELQCFSRNIERGSRVVAAVNSDTGVVLQMPRGNLEVVHPRQITLTVIRDYLDKLKYKEAVLLMKRHRVDMNLVYDHNPELFSRHINVFVTTVDDSSLFNLFLSDLKEENVLMSLYSSTLPIKAPLKQQTKEIKSSKVNEICQKIRESIEAAGKTDIHCTTVVTSFARTNPPLIDAALQKIKDWKDGGKLTVAESGLKHLLYMVDVDSLFNTALGTYDFDLVLMIAEKSQKDPKEYLPFLNDLRKLPENYRMYKIDTHLKRYESALIHISACGDEKFTECLELINQHHLYRQALKLFPENSESWKLISHDYGQHLMSKRHLPEAGLIFEECGQHQLAFECYKRSLNWRLAFSMAKIVGMVDSDIVSEANDMAERLKDKRKFSDAALVYQHYAKNLLSSVNALIEGDLWDAAYELLTTAGLDSAKEHYKSALKAKWKSLLSTCDKCSKDFVHHRDRLKTVREIKRTKMIERLENGVENDVEESEIYSEVGSSISTSSRSSSASSRVRHAKKAERKKQSLKEGSAYEDLALLSALNEVVTHVESIREDIRSVLSHLCRVGLKSEAKQLQNNHRELMAVIQSGLTEVWPSIIEVHTIPGPVRSSFEISSACPWTKEKILESLLVPPLITTEFDWQLDQLI